MFALSRLRLFKTLPRQWSLVAEKAWFEFPKLFPYGGPGFGWKFGVAAILGILAGYLGSMVESLGDYAATCAVSGEIYIVKHMNKGIFAEGLGSVVASMFGGGIFCRIQQFDPGHDNHAAYNHKHASQNRSWHRNQQSSKFGA